jgi:hypothetical protein
MPPTPPTPEEVDVVLEGIGSSPPQEALAAAMEQRKIRDVKIPDRICRLLSSPSWALLSGLYGTTETGRSSTRNKC